MKEKKTIEQRVRELGCGTAHIDLSPCDYRKRCAYETTTCKPDTCHWASQFYRRIKRP